MSVAPSSLEIHLHLTNGHVVKFGAHNAEEAESILNHVQPAKVFAQRHLIIAGSYTMTAFPTEMIGRIDLVMEGYPGWPFQFTATDLAEITEEEFHQRYRPDEYGPSRTEQEVAPGQPIVTFGAAELTNGECIYSEVHMSALQRTGLDVGLFIQQLLSAPYLLLRRRGGGAVLVNPRNIARVTFFPGPPQTPPGALPAHYLTE